jgi:spoIIIJ-associated protein
MEEPDDLQPIEEEEEEEETEFATIAGGATVEEAKRTALEQLGKIVPYVNPADVEYIVVEEGSKGGLFGRGKLLARVEARLRPSDERVDVDLPEGAEKLREFIQTVVDLMGIEAQVGASETPEGMRAEISGDDLGLLIGRHGATIDALQYVAAIVVNGDRRERLPVIVDAEGYRDRRASALTALADRTAQKVARESVSVALKPMTAAERKVIHLHLKDHPRVETVSEGNEPFRAVVVSPKQPVA